MVRLTPGWMVRWMIEWMDGRLDEWMDGWLNGRMDGWVDGQCHDGGHYKHLTAQQLTPEHNIGAKLKLCRVGIFNKICVDC